ncbi:hypothetical protein BHM03_00019801 [Ensete ventricosum]|nr:hypothetical protein BHM03_00019801 [Ensete ventricosum]
MATLRTLGLVRRLAFIPVAGVLPYAAYLEAVASSVALAIRTVRHGADFRDLGRLAWLQMSVPSFEISCCWHGSRCRHHLPGSLVVGTVRDVGAFP